MQDSYCGSTIATICIKFYFVRLQPAHPLTNSSFAHLLKALLLSVTGQNHMIYLLTTVRVEPLGWAWAGTASCDNSTY